MMRLWKCSNKMIETTLKIVMAVTPLQKIT